MIRVQEESVIKRAMEVVGECEEERTGVGRFKLISLHGYVGKGVVTGTKFHRSLEVTCFGICLGYMFWNHMFWNHMFWNFSRANQTAQSLASTKPPQIPPFDHQEPTHGREYKGSRAANY